jgi:hypothetical protein
MGVRVGGDLTPLHTSYHDNSSVLQQLLTHTNLQCNIPFVSCLALTFESCCWRLDDFLQSHCANHAVSATAVCYYSHLLTQIFIAESHLYPAWHWHLKPVPGGLISVQLPASAN